MGLAEEVVMAPRSCGPYLLYDEIASGGIGSVRLARMTTHGLARVLAVKTLHAHHAKDAAFSAMFLDEARLAARVRHPNVVSVLDIVETNDDLALVMEYIAGESLSKLVAAARAKKKAIDPAIAAAIMSDVLEGLHAAHHATNESGVPLQIIHRDVSPQNVIVGVDGVARVVDFGIAKAIGRLQDTTQEGRVKGKLTYMAPEQLVRGRTVDHRCDVWASAVVLWEMLSGEPLFTGAADAMQHHVGQSKIPRPSERGAPAVLDEVVMKGLALDADERFQSAREMLVALEGAISAAPARRVAQWVQQLAKGALRQREAAVKAIEEDAAAPARPVPSVPPPPIERAPRVVGRYALHGEIASGGSATIHYGRLLGAVGFARTVALKRLHPRYARDPSFAAMMVNEARLNARIQHPNVVQTLDVVELEDGRGEHELFLVLEYVAGASLASLFEASRARQAPIPMAVASAIVCGVLRGLEAAHVATNERGEPLGIVHRDVSPQNVMVSASGVARVLDFGIARAKDRGKSLVDGQIAGKLAYMAPEQASGGAVDRRADVFAVGVMLWELLTLERLFAGRSEAETVGAALAAKIDPPSARAAGLSAEVDALCLRALERDPSKRIGSARELADALEKACPIASPARVAEWVAELAGDELARRAAEVSKIEQSTEPASAEPAPAVVEPVAQPRPGRARWIAPAVLVVTALGVVAAAWPRPSPPPPRAEPVPNTEPAPAPASVAAPSAMSSTVAVAPSASSGRTPPRARGPAPAARPCAVRSYIDSAGITHFVKDCK